MAANEQGNDVTKVRRPITGKVFINLGLGARPTKAQLKDPLFEPELTPGGWAIAGLIKVDSGPEWTLEANGDRIEFWQEGESIPTGLSNASVSYGLAEYGDLVTILQTGEAPDADGYSVIDAAGNPNSYDHFFKEFYRGGGLRHRLVSATVAVTEDQSVRGEVLGHNVAATINYNTTIGGHLEQVLFDGTPVASS